MKYNLTSKFYPADFVGFFLPFKSTFHNAKLNDVQMSKYRPSGQTCILLRWELDNMAQHTILGSQLRQDMPAKILVFIV